MSLAFMPFVPFMPKARYQELVLLRLYFKTNAVIRNLRNSDSCKLEKWVIRLISLTAAPHFEIVEINPSTITCTCSRNDVHERNDTHDMHDSIQILLFISAYRFFRGNRSAMMSSKEKRKRS